MFRIPSNVQLVLSFFLVAVMGGASGCSPSSSSATGRVGGDVPVGGAGASASPETTGGSPVVATVMNTTISGGTSGEGTATSGGAGETGMVTASGGSAVASGGSVPVGSGGTSSVGTAGTSAVASGGSVPVGSGGTSTVRTGGTSAVASGGSSAAVTLTHGYAPTTITNAVADTAYQSWKTNFLEDCGNGSQRVKWSTTTLTVSEGIGYGMLLSVVHNDQTIFDGLWQYYKNNRDPNGLMHWQRSGCPGASSGDNAATDSDLDVAMALVMASRRWSTTPYLNDATTMIGLIKQYETTTGSNGTYLLKPGDVFGGATCLNFSYFAPGYYRVFAEVVPSQATFWNKLADDTYTLLNRVANPATGLVPNWCDENGATSAGGPSGCTGYTKADQYGSDAARTPWRISVDYIWYGTPLAQTWLNKVTSWVKTVGIANLGNWYQLDGTATSTTHSIVLVGAFADASLAYDQTTANEFFTEVANMTPPTSYYSSSLLALYSLLPLGRFTPQGGL